MFDFDDWGSWGVGDFYNGNEEELVDAINSGKPFDTGWHGFKKELESLRIARDDINVTVYVSTYMDEALGQAELFSDFLEDDEWELLTDEKLEEIRDYLYMGDFVEEITLEDKLPLTATYKEIMNKATELMESCHETLHHSFLECIGTTLYVLYINSPDRDEIIRERLEQYK